MTTIELDMIQTAGLGALALFVGMILTRKTKYKIQELLRMVFSEDDVTSLSQALSHLSP